MCANINAIANNLSIKKAPKEYLNSIDAHVIYFQLFLFS